MKTLHLSRIITFFTVFVMAISFWIPAAETADSFCDARENNNYKKLLECVTLDGVLRHLAEFQTIADANSGTRASGTAGYDASAAYVASLMAAAGYDVTVQEFSFDAFRRLDPSVLQQTTPGTVVYSEQIDFNVAEFSAPGDVTAPVTSVDLQLGGISTSGCEASDFAGFPAGNIALMRRGTCTFRVKAENAAAAGAAGAIIFNTGGGSSDLFTGTLSSGYTGGIPVFLATYNRGIEWDGTPGLILQMDANVSRTTVTTSNVIAEALGGRDDRVLVIGAPLDSAFYYLNSNSPGINNNGSGAAAILEIALMMKRVTPVNKVRFIWWGAEEEGRNGSDYYLISLTTEELASIKLYLGFGAIGSPNFVRFIYDRDSAIENAIEAQFENIYTALGVPYKSTSVFINASHFIDAGIPVGGLFTGNIGIKTAEEVTSFGGTAGIQYDPCYRLACDTYSNINQGVLDQNADAAAYAVIQNAMGSLPGKIKLKNQEILNPSGLAVY